MARPEWMRNSQKKDSCTGSTQKPDVYTFQTRVRYSECSAGGQVRLSGILDYLQDTCTMQAEDLGVGVRYMREHQTAWVLNSWQADICRYPELGEQITIRTWPYGFQGQLWKDGCPGWFCLGIYGHAEKKTGQNCTGSPGFL